MESTITRVDQLEIASLFERIALFTEAGCKPQQAIDFSLSSMQDDAPLAREIEAAIDAEGPGRSPADLLLDMSRRLDNESLLLASMAFVAHVELGIELSQPLTTLAEAIRWRAGTPSGRGAEFEREVAVVSLAHKMAYLIEIDKSPREALAILGDYDQVLGPELQRIHCDLRLGYLLPEAFARSVERTGSGGLKMLATAIEVCASMEYPLTRLLRQAADVIRRDMGI
jgi:Flp pilus assembly protein TadB